MEGLLKVIVNFLKMLNENQTK